MGANMADATVIIDYQNIHLTGHEIWCPSSEAPHLCLIHPLHFALQVLQQRNLIRRLLAKRNGSPFEDAVLKRVVAYRGQPSNRHEPTAYARTQAQRSEWTRDRRSQVQYRPLKYYPSGKVAEKGIDVLIALQLVQVAAQLRNDSNDIVILAAHDTDQEPALEMAYRLAPGQIETAGWQTAKQLKVKGCQFWHTSLDEDRFEKARDQRIY